MGRVHEEGSGRVHGFRLSTVSTSRPTEAGTSHEPSGLDIAMKLHYLKLVYIYSAETARDLTVAHVKGPLFPVFDQVPWTNGRLRRHDSGRPYIKCNDCGTRIVESQCDLTVEEWLRVADRSVDESLVYHQPIGPELAFSPLIYIQMTRFKCGGLAFGFSWAHIMGDPFALHCVFNLWTRIFAGEKIQRPKTSGQEREFPKQNFTETELDSISRVDPVGDLWVTPNNNKMTRYSFNVKICDMIKSHISLEGDEFDLLCGIIWKCIAKAKADSKPATVTIVRSNPNSLKFKPMKNNQMIGSVHVNFSVSDAGLEEIVKSIREAADERSAIDAVGGSNEGVLDFIIYGAKLTFVDMSKINFYEVEIRGTSPESVYCNVQGIGDHGAVVVLPTVKEEERLVTITLSEDDMEKVKWELQKCGLITPLINEE